MCVFLQGLSCLSDSEGLYIMEGCLFGWMVSGPAGIEGSTGAWRPARKPSQPPLEAPPFDRILRTCGDSHDHISMSFKTGNYNLNTTLPSDNLQLIDEIHIKFAFVDYISWNK